MWVCLKTRYAQLTSFPFLIELGDWWGNATDKMCLGFRKTFDRVSGDVIVGKMKIYELGDN